MLDRHRAFKENLAAYALDALDAGEAAKLEAHLRTCKSCPAELKEYRRLSAGLLSALPPQAPRPGVKRSLQRRLTHRTAAPQQAAKWSFSRLAAVGTFALLIGLNILSLLQVRALRQEQAEVDQRNAAEQTAIAMLAYPGTQVLGFEQNGVSGSLLTDKQRDLLAVFAWNLPIAPAGKTYQVWLIDPQGNRLSGGFLAPEAGYPFVMTVIKSPAPLAGFKGLGVTVEPLGGSPGPTGPKILGVNF